MSQEIKLGKRQAETLTGRYEELIPQIDNVNQLLEKALRQSREGEQFGQESEINSAIKVLTEAQTIREIISSENLVNPYKLENRILDETRIKYQDLY